MQRTMFDREFGSTVENGSLSARRAMIGRLFAGFAIAAILFVGTAAFAQDDTDRPIVEPSIELSERAPQEAEAAAPKSSLNILNLLVRGGWFMVPLGLLSIAVVTLAIERLLALRRDKMLPTALVQQLGNLSQNPSGFDPREAYRICQKYPSAASRVVKSMLLKVGRPQGEVENAVADTSQREAARFDSVVSWLTLCAAVAPLIGLLGTVWGLIQAFYDTTQLQAGASRTDMLAAGIYTALVTTMCGLTIAIPAAMLAHFFENRIIGWFHRIEELVTSLTPQIERFEGRVRFNDELVRELTGSPSQSSAGSGFTGENAAAGVDSNPSSDASSPSQTEALGGQVPG